MLFFKTKIASILVILAVTCNSIVAENYFSIVSRDATSSVIIDRKESKVVDIAAHILCDDIKKVSGVDVSVLHQLKSGAIVAGTIGQSAIIDEFIAKGFVDVKPLLGQWESYSIQVIKNPFKDIEDVLLIVGSDRRATAYGLLEVSRMIGVSPWEWWADVQPEKKERLTVAVQNKIYGSPSVKYRGIFLNDEDWGLQRWAALNYEPETGDIGPKTYAKVFELLLRLRANMLWPAMHSCTKPFYYYPENKQVADDYAIVVGTSHCEPMLCNINAEWKSNTMGEWRYDTNANTIKDLFASRTEESAPFESIYTMGMRGEHDSPMIVGEDNSDAQAKLLENVIHDQREILEKHTQGEADQIPQIFIPYKEVLTYYKKGIDLPEDISLVWTDDNYGYIRQLSNEKEQKRSGGAGIYYHTSYWGRPHDYLWLNSTNPVLMWEEMAKAYAFQSRRVWVLNCGDIKPHEYNIELFLDMAWDMEAFTDADCVEQHMQHWAGREFGAEQANPITQLMYEYYRLAFQRRPEFMAWSHVEPVTKAGETSLTQIHYGDEVSQRILAYDSIIARLAAIKEHIPEYRADAYYQLVAYPLSSAAYLNHKWLYAFKNKFVAQQGRSSAERYAQKSQDAYQQIVAHTQYYNHQLQGGKWNHMMSMSPRYLPVFSPPTLSYSYSDAKAGVLGLAVESYEMEVNHSIINSYADVLPVFNAYAQNKYYIDLFIKGEGSLAWKAIPQVDWIKLSAVEGQLSDTGTPEQRLWVSIDWDKVPQGEDKKEAPLGHDYQLIPPSYKVNSAIDFVCNDSTLTLGVSVYNPQLDELKDYVGFVEDKGFISINAENYTHTERRDSVHWEQVFGIGYTGSVVRAMPLKAASQTDILDLKQKSPVLEYDFYSFNFGEAMVYLQVVPTHAFNDDSGVRIAVAIDDDEPIMVDFQTFGRSAAWAENVLRNASIQACPVVVDRAGKHTLKVWMVDPGVMLDQILINLGGWKESYLFPPQSYWNATLNFINE